MSAGYAGSPAHLCRYRGRLRAEVRDRVRLPITVGLDRSGAQQLVLPFTDTDVRALAIDAAVDEVRRRYGKSALARAELVGRDPGLEMPHLPD